MECAFGISINGWAIWLSLCDPAAQLRVGSHSVGSRDVPYLVLFGCRGLRPRSSTLVGSHGQLTGNFLMIGDPEGCGLRW